MCGLVGFHAYRSGAPPVDRAEVLAVRDAMAARGPDGEGAWWSGCGRAGLAHRRLAIIDPGPEAAQPMASGDGRCAISFNGEIYNHRELRAALEREGAIFRTHSDTEVLLHLYERHGERMVDHLRGMFAFALWDEREQALLVARDPYGIKPLYIADDGATVRVASQVKALLRADVDRRPDPAGHAGFWLWGSVPEPWTLYRGIRALPAGHFQWFRRGRAESPRSFCSIVQLLAEAAEAPARGTRQDAIAAIRDGIEDSIRAHLVADVPVGVFLSSGLDSGMICARAARLVPDTHTLTLAFSEYAGTHHDERPLAEAIAAKLGTRHETVVAVRDDFVSERVRLLAAMDQPSIDGVNTWFVARAAASRGIKVALSGLGGDELFASYPSFRQVPALASLTRPFAHAPRLARLLRPIAAGLGAATAKPKMAGVLELGGSIPGAYLLRRGLHMPWELPGLLGEAVAREGLEALDTLARLGATAPAGLPPRLAVTALESTWYMRNQLLRDADWAGMAHSLEIRTPLADVKLLRDLAPWFAAHPGITKAEIAEAVAPSLHDAWLTRPKTGFTVPVRQWLGLPTKGQANNMRAWGAGIDQAFDGPAQRAALPSRRVLLLVTDAFGGHGGIAFHNRCLAEAIAQMPDVAEVTVVPRVMRFAPGPLPPKVRFLQHAAGSKPRFLASVLSLARERCDLVVCGHMNLMKLAVPFARFKRVPVVLEAYGIEAWKARGVLDRRLLRELDAVWSISDFTTGRMNAWAHIDAGRFRPMPCTYHPEQFSPGPRNPDLVRRFGLQDRKVIMTLARLAGFERYKGIDEILDCMHALIEREPSLVYMVVGDGDDQPRLERKVRGLGLEERVIFTGFVRDEDKADYLRLADVFALPGRGEGFGIVFLEALACGVPVVGSRVDGSRDALLQGTLGELADPDSPESIVECVVRALRKPREVPAELESFGWPSFQQCAAGNVRAALGANP